MWLLTCICSLTCRIFIARFDAQNFIYIYYTYTYLYIFIYTYIFLTIYHLWFDLLYYFFIFIVAFLIVVYLFFFFRTIIVYSFHCGHARQAWTDHSAALTAASVARYAMYLLAQPFSQEIPLIIYEIFWNIYDPYSWFHFVTTSFENLIYISKFVHRWWTMLPCKFSIILLFTLHFYG